MHALDVEGIGTVWISRSRGVTSARAVRHETTVTLRGTVREAIDSLRESVEEVYV
jgi:hypothetical protein